MSTVAVDWNESTLGQGDDFVRSALLGALISNHLPEGSILDIGCDTGKLKGLLGKLEYFGIDARTEAVETARKLFPGSNFECVRAEDWVSVREFDAVVFNESLYYLADVRGSLYKFHQCLRAGGLLAISIYKRPGWLNPNGKALKYARTFIGSSYESIHDFMITSKGASWNILVARKIGK